MRPLALLLAVLVAGCGGSRVHPETGLPGNAESPSSLALPGPAPREAPDPLRSRVERAYRAAREGDLPEAEALVDSLCTPGAHWRSMGSILAWIALRGEDRERAIRAARLAFEADSTTAANQNNRGITFLMEGDPRSARRSFLRARAIDPAMPGPLYNLAIAEQFYFMNEEAARGWFERYLSLAADDPDDLRSVLGPASARR